MGALTTFDPLAQAYDHARPDYPDALFDALETATGPLADTLVLEGGAGTGLATRSLADRGAHVVAFDISRAMLQRGARNVPEARMVVADANLMPFADGCADLLCFAQSWHWLDLTGAAQREAARVLRPGCWWAGWWSHARADGQDWFERYKTLFVEAIDGFSWQMRDVDWGQTIAVEAFDEPVRADIAWTRNVSIDTWLLDEQSKSYVGALPAPARRLLLDDVESVLRDRFPTGELAIPYTTWLWTARRRALVPCGLSRR